jgi:hypothetical protein
MQSRNRASRAEGCLQITGLEQTDPVSDGQPTDSQNRSHTTRIRERWRVDNESGFVIRELGYGVVTS